MYFFAFFNRKRIRCEYKSGSFRVSTDEQRDNRYSIDNQIRMLTKHCEGKNFIMMLDILERFI